MALGRPVSLTSNIASKTISVTATASQTLFTVTGGYNINELGVFRNGIRLVDGRDYLARDGSSVTLLSAASGGDIIEFHIFDVFSVAEAIKPNESSQTINGDLAINGNLNVTGIITASDIVGVSTLFTGAIGIQSAGTVIGAGITQLNFIGSGNTFAVSGTTVDISISGGSGGGLGKAVGDQNAVFSYIEQYGEIDETITLDTSNSGVNTSIIVTVNPILAINDSNTVTVGAGKSLVVDILQIGDLFEQ